jgi:hypothetical protein
MADIAGLRRAVVDRVLDGEGEASRSRRRAAFDLDLTGLPEPVRALVEKTALHAYKVTDDDVAAANAAVSEDELFELVVSAALGQATRQLDAARAAIAAADSRAAAKGAG